MKIPHILEKQNAINLAWVSSPVTGGFLSVPLNSEFPRISLNVPFGLKLIRDFENRFIGLMSGEIYRPFSHEECFLVENMQVSSDAGKTEIFKRFSVKDGPTLSGFRGNWFFMGFDFLQKKLLFSQGCESDFKLAYHWTDEEFKISVSHPERVESSPVVIIESGRFYQFEFDKEQLASFPAREEP